MSKKNSSPEPIPGQWVGTAFMLPGEAWKSVKVRLSKQGERCKFVQSRYIPADGHWYDRSKEDIEIDGWKVTMWFLPTDHRSHLLPEWS